MEGAGWFHIMNLYNANCTAKMIKVIKFMLNVFYNKRIKRGQEVE